MLRRFSVSGCRSFRDKLTFDLTKAHEYEFNNHLVKDGLISSGVIYGVNGSGKSNLGFALFDIVGVLTDYELATPMKDKAAYLNAENERGTAYFEYEFDFCGHVVNYSYEKSAPDEIQNECLTADGRIILSRIGLNTEYENTSLKIPELPPRMSALRYIYRNTPLKDINPIAQTVEFAGKMLWFRSLNSRGYCGYTSGTSVLTDELNTPEKVKEFESYLYEMAGIELKLEVLVSPSGKRELYIVYPNRKLEFFSAASTGTQELLLLYYWKKFALKDVKFLFIDEFDAFYHYELSAKIVKDISRRTGMQSFFTSHNTYLANNRIMRPDCFFILSDGKITSFADATERELREGHNLEKLLRSGEFGV